MKWNRFIGSSFGSGRTPGFFEDVVGKSADAAAPAGAPPPAGDSELVIKLQAASPDSRRNLVQEFVESEVRKLLGQDSGTAIDPQTGFMDMGIDSLMAIDFRNRLKGSLGAVYGKSLPTTLIMNYPNLTALVDYLMKDVLVFEAKNTSSEKKSSVAKRSGKEEYIAIVGTSCRLPGGAVDLSSYWKVLSEGIDGIVDVPPDRWNADDFYDPNQAEQGKISTRSAGFISDVDKFDAAFFGISSAEATEIDPQQRILLEAAWEALEDAGIVPGDLMGTQTGVFVGASIFDYARLHVRNKGHKLSGYFGIGTLPPALAGRISYFLGLRGPSLVVDTACSSSLVAIHQACQSLKSYESNLCIAAGVNLILTPDISISFSRAGMLSPSGRCKTFDESADGYARAEGLGVVVLKRLSDARADGDRILAVIRGTGSNQDGRSSSLTAPNGPAQEALLRDVLDRARIQPAEVSYYEAHGTGTSLGDPIEVNALGSVLRENREKSNQLIIGSHKSNIGHTEPAAGVAGVLKIVASLAHKKIPPNLHFKKLNPKISLEEIPAIVADKLTEWNPPAGKPRFAAISAFGFTGTNASAVIEEGPVPGPSSGAIAQDGKFIFPLSARSEWSLNEYANRYLRYIEANPSVSLASLCAGASMRRSHFQERAAIAVGSTRELKEKLQEFQAAGASVKRGKVVRGKSDRIAFLFSGQGTQYVGMGKELYQSQPVFKEAMDACAEGLKKYLDIPLLPLIFEGSPSPDLLHRTKYTQPALFALEYSLFQLWKSWGIEPACAVGHSVGEVVAACAAGFFSLENGLMLIAKRAELMDKLTGDGGMVAVGASEKQVAELIKEFGENLSLAAINGPEAVTVSGYKKELGAFVEKAKGLKLRTKELVVSHAFHSRQMDAMLNEFIKAIAQIKVEQPKFDVFSNLTGSKLEKPDANYWARQIREAVRFADCIRSCEEKGCHVFLEVGPGTTLVGLANACTVGATTGVPSINKGHGDQDQIFETCASLYVNGANLKWQALLARFTNLERLALPTYPFEKNSYWMEEKGMKLVEPNPAEWEGAQIKWDLSLSGKDVDARKRALSMQLGGLIKSITGMSKSAEVPADLEFTALGMDSLAVIEFVKQVKTKFRESVATAISTETMFKYPTLATLVSHLDKIVFAGEEVSGSPAVETIRPEGWYNHVNRSSRRGKVRLFCFAHAGGDELLFSPWKKTDPNVEVFVMKVPGKGSRLMEDPLTDAGELVARAAAAIEHLLDLPFAVMGHSLGGNIAYDFARFINEKFGKTPVMTIVSSSMPFHLLKKLTERLQYETKGKVDQLPDGELLSLMERVFDGGISQALLQDELLRTRYARALRADLHLFDARKSVAPVSWPVLAIGGKSDGSVSMNDMEGWRSLTTGPFKLEQVAGGHFHLRTNSEALEIIGRHLNDLLEKSAIDTQKSGNSQKGTA